VKRHIEELRPDELHVDPLVQRDRPPRPAVNKMVQDWRREMTGVLVASHRDDGLHYLLDGQTRRAAALLCDPAFRFVVEVHEGLTRADEIDLFEYHNRNRRQVAAIELLKLRVNRAREPYARVGIELARRGVGLAKNSKSPSTISSAEPIEWLLRTSPKGARLLGTALDVVMHAYPHEPTRFRGAFFMGVCYLLHVADRGRAAVDVDRLARVLQRQLPQHWERKAADLRQVAGVGNARVTGIAVGRMMIELYNKRLIVKNQLPTPWKDESDDTTAADA
jgi:hypothetical protein